MTLGRLLLILIIVGLLGWLVVRTVSVRNNGDQVNITIDKNKIREAGHDVVEQGRRAVDKTGQLLERAEDRLDHPDANAPPPGDATEADGTSPDRPLKGISPEQATQPASEAPG